MMKKIPALVVFLALAIPAFAQGQEPLIRPTAESGGYGAVFVSPTRINDATGIMIGGGGCWVVDHTLAIGGMGTILVNGVRGTGRYPETRRKLTFGYGGAIVEYTPISAGSLHCSAHLLIGLGGVDYHGDVDEPRPTPAKTSSIDIDIAVDPSMEAFGVAEPGVSLELDVARGVRVAVGGGYRFIGGADLDGATDAGLSGPLGALTLKVGVF